MNNNVEPYSKKVLILTYIISFLLRQDLFKKFADKQITRVQTDFTLINNFKTGNDDFELSENCVEKDRKLAFETYFE